MLALMTNKLTADVARAVVASAKAKIKTDTRQEIGKSYSVFLQGLLHPEHGRDTATLYYALTESGGVVAAKVYNGDEDAFQREVSMSQALDHENLVKFIKSFSIQEGARNIIIMPFYPRSVADLLENNCPVPLEMFRRIARNCYDALSYLHSKGFCFVDVKPSNIMLEAGEQGHAVLVDYGATVRTGKMVEQLTEVYCLDADTWMATEYLDWICFGTTLAEMAGFDIFAFHGAYDLAEEVNESTKDDAVKQLIVSCLVKPTPSAIEAALSLATSTVKN
ncbi:hypothetical protein HDU96_003434 [Phlyctochytrium bullatum]|nr:hypothetical protein HDU96_003434 [Phlyctochytrium bullatum]